MTRTKKDWQDTTRMISRLQEAGISADDAWSLRRISMTLQRWHELECGDGNEYGSWAIERDDGHPFMVHNYYLHDCGKGYTTRTPIPDREKGAHKRLARIMARYPALKTYVQGDPRGCALYVIRPGDVREGLTLDCCYSNGIAVHQ